MVEPILSDVKARFAKLEQDLVRKLEKISLQTKKASADLLEGIQIDYYGSPAPIVGIASISLEAPATLLVRPHEAAFLGAIEKKLREKKEDWIIQQRRDGCVQAVLPPVTKERREQLSKEVEQAAQSCKVELRQLRMDAKKKMQKADGLSEDQLRKGETKLQQMVKEQEEAIDSQGKAAISRIMQV